ncbi:TadE/TadG family type IV pilus assembly protein [Tabrizicola sp.]|uniref:TadE/TadG family type IV pilus assembly protein n=1 Tax=Tabrizicola sp. TaxID=2005166 RepID=UPI0035B32510
MVDAGDNFRSPRAYLRDEEASATIEFVLWLPIVLLILLLIVDASMLFMSRSQAIRILQDTNRLYSTGQFTGETLDEKLAKAEAYALSRLQPMSPSATADTSESLNRVVRTVATLETGEISQIGFLGVVIDRRMTVVAEHRVEF